MLYYPGYFGGATAYHPSEAVFTWSEDFCDAPTLSVSAVEHALFFDAGRPKTHDCYFVHKGGKWRDVKEVEGLVEINDKFPPTRAEMAELLQSTGTLYSFDPDTILLWEAKLCGVKRVLVVEEDGFREYTGDPPMEEAPETYARQLDNFIEKTQAMPAAAKLERPHPVSLIKAAAWNRAKRLARLVLGEAALLRAIDLIHGYRRRRFAETGKQEGRP